MKVLNSYDTAISSDLVINGMKVYTLSLLPDNIKCYIQEEDEIKKIVDAADRLLNCSIPPDIMIKKLNIPNSSMTNPCNGCFGAADLQCPECPKNKTVSDEVKDIENRYHNILQTSPKIVRHFMMWRDWSKMNRNSVFYKFCVLIGIANSPTFEIHKMSYDFTSKGE